VDVDGVRLPVNVSPDNYGGIVKNDDMMYSIKGACCFNLEQVVVLL
jgi:CO dehydrogenase/acetyl-CoA synthase beta subunit